MKKHKIFHLPDGYRLNKAVFYPSALIIIIFSIFTIAYHQLADNIIKVVLNWVSSTFGWYLLLVAVAYSAFVIITACSRYGDIRLGPSHSRPEFSTLAWAAMLFTAGIGIDLMFFSVAEPIAQYYHPPVGEGQNIAAARQAIVWTLFHYGLTGWAMYALMGMSLGYFSYRYNLPITIRSALYPIFGKHIKGIIGHLVDIAAILGASFGIATTLGIGVMQLNYGLNVLADFPMSNIVQITLILLTVIISLLSALSGVNQGIKFLSFLNIYLAIVLVIFLLFAGDKEFLFNALILNIGDYLTRLPSMLLDNFAFTPNKGWLNDWTLFFWAWWIAWAPFVGLFLARISRGRTIRQFVFGTLIIPFIFTLVWISIFGNSVLYQVLNGNELLGQNVLSNPELGLYELLRQYPYFKITTTIATFTGLLFYVTSASSGSLVLGNFCTIRDGVNTDAPNLMRVFWSVVIGLLTIAMLMANGISALQNATIAMGLPFSFVMILIMFGLYRSFKLERYRQSSQAHIKLANKSSIDWRHRLKLIDQLPNLPNIKHTIENIFYPAISELCTEFNNKGINAKVQLKSLAEQPTLNYIDFMVDFTEEQNFIYQIKPKKYPTPPYSEISQQQTNYFQLETFLLDGGQGNNISSFSDIEVINDLLDQYEKHLIFLKITREAKNTLIFPNINRF